MKNFLLACILLPQICFGQTDGTAVADTVAAIPAGRFVYEKPRAFSFITNIPRDAFGFTKHSFTKRQYKNWTIIAGSTAVLLLLDDHITHGFQHFCHANGIEKREGFAPLLQMNIGGKATNIGKIPKNINTALYNLGQGSATMLLAGSFYLAGKINHDNRALQTAGQLAESFLVMGLGTQALKYITGRENPSEVAAGNRCRWRPAPGWGNFQNNKPGYDAFPSGHLATLISTVTIISQNYPERKWIKPVGYFLSSLCGLAMINNGVHWAGDFPLGIAMGYGYARYIAKKNRRFQLV